MPRVAKDLLPGQVKNLKSLHQNRPTKHPVGGVSGLLLQVTPNEARSWLLRTTVGGKRREYGLGAYPEVSLGEAKDAARIAKGLIKQGRDPSEERKEAQRKIYQQNLLGKIFVDVVLEFTPIKQAHLAKTKYREQWADSIRNHACPIIGNKLVSDITDEDILAVLRPIWLTMNPTAEKLQMKLQEVFEYAIAQSYRIAANPARRSKRFELFLPSSTVLGASKHYPAVQAKDLGRFWRALQKRDGHSALALKFQILTATRTGAVRNMTWDEVELDEGVWTVQPGRDAAKISIRGPAKKVLLSRAATEILASMPKLNGCNFVFWSPTGKAFSDAALASVMKKISEEDVKQGGTGFLDVQSKSPAVPHGFRSTFKDWSLEVGGFENDLSEMALWHNVGSKTEQAYNRAERIAQRSAMMEAWSGFIEQKSRESILA